MCPHSVERQEFSLSYGGRQRSGGCLMVTHIERGTLIMYKVLYFNFIL